MPILVCLLAGCAATPPRVTVFSKGANGGDDLYQVRHQPLEVAKSTAAQFCERLQRPMREAAIMDMDPPKGAFLFQCGQRPTQIRSADGSAPPEFGEKCRAQGKVIRSRKTDTDPHTITLDCVAPGEP